ncbi:Survival motor neuron-like protein 1 [Trichoderma lentiforme]|uniref:Survival motor neuron-like protein 1 n=1 Tax=Trichoderma lentiforme TaxID=1567552 RepID=A0A9P5CHJ0_9HYPO|nr:Survival motor neuron-like protein 1 [Trichoderma lentiforme]
MNIDESDPHHEEVWDDSLLIDSWNQALKEYKKYHSIHAKGGNIRDLGEADASSSKKVTEALKVDESGSQPVAETVTETEKHVEELPSNDADAAMNDSSEQHSSQPGPGLSSIPNAFPSQAILGTVRDDNLKKLLMSWYYAGYYTGLFEGQQQAQQQAPQP